MRTLSDILLDVENLQKSFNILIFESKSLLDSEDEANIYLDDFYDGFNYGVDRLIEHIGGFLDVGPPSENKQ